MKTFEIFNFLFSCFEVIMAVCSSEKDILIKILIFLIQSNLGKNFAHVNIRFVFVMPLRRP